MILCPAYKNKNIAVFGLGKSGRATYASLKASGANVVAWDDKAQETESLPLMPYQQWDWDALDVLVLSPGIPLTHPAPHEVVTLAKQHHVRITCDITLLMEAQPDATFIGITGTNGKSTTTALIAHCLQSLGATVQCGGNIGTAALSMQPLDQGAYYVLELSSYQLDLMDAGAINIACLLNITPDHLDRHGGMAGYIAAKERIFARQHDADYAIIAIDDEYTKQIAAKRDAITVSVTHQDADYYVENHILYDVNPVMLSEAKHPETFTKADRWILHSVQNDEEQQMQAIEEFALANLKHLQGTHNYQNTLIAYAVCRECGFEPHDVYDAMFSFSGLEHRMELVRTIGDVRFVNDSKATNAEAAAQSLATYKNIHWICGGVAKEGGIEALRPLFGNVAHAYLIGQCADNFAQTLGDVPHHKCSSLVDAVKVAYANAKGTNNVILLAPAAASFDMFLNFEVRGEMFKEIVRKLD